MGCVIAAIVLCIKPVLFSLFNLIHVGSVFYLFSGFLVYNKPKDVLVSEEQDLDPLNFKTMLKIQFSASVCYSVSRLVYVILFFFDWQAINYKDNINGN